MVPEAKSNVAWVDRDHLLVGDRLWPGQPDGIGLSADHQAVVARHAAGRGQDFFTGEQSDVSATPFAYVTGDALVVRHARQDVLDQRALAGRRDGRLVKTPLPDTADLSDAIGGRLIAFFNKADQGMPAGSVVAYSLADIAAGRPAGPSW